MRLSTKITLFFLVVGLLPLLLLSWFIMIKIEETVRVTTNNALLSLSTQIGQEVKRAVSEGYDNIQLLSQNPSLAAPDASRNEQQTALNKTLSYHKVFKDITLLDASGNIRASVRHSFRGSWKTTIWFKEAMTGRSILSDVHAVLYPFEIVMTALTPVRGQYGKVTGVLVGQIDMEYIWKITRNVSLGDKAGVILLDHNGIVIASPREDDLLKRTAHSTLLVAARNKKRGVVAFSDTENVSKIAAITPLTVETEGTPLVWSVAIIQPRSQAYSAITGTQFAVVCAIGICLLVVMILSPLLSRQISSRIERLERAAQKIGEGDLSVRIDDPGNDEIGELGRVLNWASAELDAYHQKIKDYSGHLEQQRRGRVSLGPLLLRTAHGGRHREHHAFVSRVVPSALALLCGPGRPAAGRSS